MQELDQQPQSFFSQNLAFILSCLRSRYNPCEADLLRKSIHQIDSWDDFIELVEFHRTLPMVFTVLKEYAWDNVPEFAQQTLKDKFQENALSSLFAASETATISQLLDSKDVPNLILKGSAAGMTIYGNLSLRSTGDIDILIRPDHFERADTILNEIGYHVMKSRYPEIHLMKKIRKRALHHFTYEKEKKPCPVELHWRLHSYGSISQMPIDDLFNNSVYISIGSKRVRTLSVYHNLLYLLIHGSLHEWFAIFWLCDVAEILHKSQIHFEKLLNEADRINAIRPTILGLILCQRILKSTLSEVEKKKKDPLMDYLVDHCLGVISKQTWPPKSLIEARDQIKFLLHLFDSSAYKTEVLMKSIVTSQMLSRFWDRYILRRNLQI